MTTTRYEDCDRCGERFHDEDARRYLTTHETAGGARRLCLTCVSMARDARPTTPKEDPTS
jgi:hypothetical protein